MKTKIVYAIVSDEKDHYLEQLIVSLYSLRKHNPEANVTIVCDDDTYNSFTGWREQIKDYNVEIIHIDVSHYPKKLHKSRYLKTTLRETVKGDFFYIDSDTIIMHDLSEIDNVKEDLGFITDCNLNYIVPSEYEKCKKVGFERLKDSLYFNGGVTYAKDSDLAHKFYRQWHETWKKTLEKGVPQDQPSYNHTIQTSGIKFKRLSNIWNYQMKISQYVPNPYVVHYFGDSYSLEFREYFYNKIRKPHTEQVLDNIISNTLCYWQINRSSKFDKFSLSESTWAYYNAPNIYRIVNWVNRFIIRSYMFLSKPFYKSKTLPF